MRSVFSVLAKDVRLGNGGPPGQQQAAADGWRAVTRVLRSCGKTARSVVLGLRRDVVNAWFPYECRACGSSLVEYSPVPLCAACIEGEAMAAGELCHRCGEALGWESARERAANFVVECRSCRWSPPEFERAVSATAYDGSTREVLHLLKYSRMRETARHVLGVRLARTIAELRPETGADLVVVPVPLHAARLAQRGYNQAEVLARAALASLRRSDRAWNLQLEPTVLTRVKAGRRMYSLKPVERRQQIRGAFRVSDRERVRGRDVLLIDDILTTGSTARECARVLRKAGATRVWVATVARTQPISAKADRADSGLPADVALWNAPSTAAEKITGARSGVS